LRGSSTPNLTGKAESGTHLGAYESRLAMAVVG